MPLSLMGQCAGGRPLPLIRADCRVVISDCRLRDDHKSRLTVISIPNLPNIYVPATHALCKCNLLVGLHNRVLGSIIQVDPGMFRAMQRTGRLIATLAGRAIPWPVDRMPYMYTGAKARRYQDAYRRFISYGQRRNFAQVTAFVKAERLDPSAKVWPYPRIIQFRSPEYCVEISQYMKPVEHSIYSLEGDGYFLPEGRLIGKGLNSWDRGGYIEQYFVKGTAVIQLDLSQFDKYYSKRHLQLEQSVYLKMLWNARFKALLHKQLVNYGQSFHNVSYVCAGNRMSGDMNTAVGACLMMLIVTVTVLRELSVPMDVVHLLIDGDDTLVFLPEDIARRIRVLLIEGFARCGFVLKVDGYATTIEDIKWCQTRPVYTPTGYRCVRDYRKVLSQALSGFKYVDNEKSRKRLAAAVGSCEYVCGRGIPILQEYALAILRNAAGARPIDFDEIDDRYYHMRYEDKSVLRLPPQPISVETRLSFARAFGVEPLMQVHYEAYLSHWSFSFCGLELEGPLLDSDWHSCLLSRPCGS